VDNILDILNINGLRHSPRNSLLEYRGYSSNLGQFSHFRQIGHFCQFCHFDRFCHFDKFCHFDQFGNFGQFRYFDHFFVILVIFSHKSVPIKIVPIDMFWFLYYFFFILLSFLNPYYLSPVTVSTPFKIFFVYFFGFWKLRILFFRTFFFDCLSLSRLSWRNARYRPFCWNLIPCGL
jgi:hypothetical protein